MELGSFLLLAAVVLIFVAIGVIAFLMIQRKQIEASAEERADALIAESMNEGEPESNVSELRKADAPDLEMKEAA